jgi:hypothetical protein
MSKRGVVTDYAGKELYPGDLVNYAVRQGNRVRLTDAVVHKVTARKEGGRLVPLLLVAPTGTESGFTRRRSRRKVWIGAEHARLIWPEFTTVETPSHIKW